MEKTQSPGYPKKWNLVQHTDNNGVTHIEVEANVEQKSQMSHNLVGFQRHSTGIATELNHLDTTAKVGGGYLGNLNNFNS